MNIPVLGCCADDLLGRVRNFLMDGAMREAGYLFKYKTNVTELEKNLVKLEGVFSRVQDGVIKDRRNAKEVYEDVSKWMDDADRMKKDLEAFLEERIQKRAQGVCFKLPFPNLYYRFKLGREATKKSAAVSELIKDGEPLKKSDHEVAHLPALVEGSALFPADHKYQTFESREKVLKDIVAALKDDTVAIVGIYGMPGVGKTTMMQQVRNQLVGEKCFEEVSFAVVSATLDVKSIQRQLANGLGLTDLAVMEDERERAMLLERRLNNGKKVLLILDDVWSKLSLADIGIGFGDAKSSKILMTSREKRVCDNNNCRAFKIELLNKDEAWCLFKQHAGDCIEKPEIRPLANKVLKECGELPLVIRAIGEALKAGDLFEWEDALVQLNNFSPQKIGNVDVQVYKTLELSFNLLKSQETKVCLLLCSFFGEDAKIPIDDLTRLAKAMGYLPDMDSLWKARNRVLSMVKILKTSGLLLEGGDENTVQMHDVIRDIAVSIAPKELNYGILVKSGIPEWPKADETCQRYGAVSLRLDRILELPRILECPQLRTFSLRNYGSYDPIQVPNNFFGLLEELNVLEMTHVSISSALLSLPNPKNLRMLCLERCELEDITILKGFHELEVLILKYSTIQGLPWEFRELKNLRLLNLERSELGVIQPGVLASLSYLEEFYMPYSYNWDANVTTNEIASISILDELFSLTRITTLEIHIPDIMTFPDYEFCKKLVRYNISVAGSSGYYYMRTRTIVIESETYVDLKGGIKILVEGAEVLYFRVSHGLQKVFNESNGGGFVDLKHLLVSSCIGMEYLLNYRQLPSGSFSKLNLLNVSNSGFKYLFSASVARGLEQLQELRIDECKAMEAIVRNECSGDEEEIVDLVIFHKLKSVLLTSLESLTSFYSEIRKTREHPNSNPAHSLFNEKVAFPALDNLYIRELGNIRCIWENKCNIGNSFSQLRSLEAVQCTRLENFVPLAMVQQLQNLEELIIRGCAAVTSEVVCSTSKEPFQAEVTPQLAKLRKLVLQNLPNLKQTTLNSNELHGIIYPKLTELCILNCGSLSNVFSPSVARNLEHLKILEIRDSEEIVEIIAAAIQGQEETSDEIIFPHLTYLELKNTPKLRNIWNHGCQEQHEEIKVVSNLHQPEPLFSKKVGFPCLQTLRLSLLESCSLDMFPSGHRADSFSKLSVVKLQECRNLSAIVSTDSLVRLQNLRELVVENCGEIRELFDLEGLDVQKIDYGLLSRMCTLKLKGLAKLQFLWNKGSHGFLGLEVLVIDGCSILKNMFSCSVARGLGQLRVFIIRLCPVMEEVIYDDEGDKGRTGDQIVFPQLTLLKLETLPKLTSFCSANYALNMPSLTAVGLYECHQMESFSAGQIHTPRIRISSCPHQSLWITNLNNYLQGSTVDGNNADEYHGDPEFSNYGIFDFGDDYREVCSPSSSQCNIM